jgi:hypothetical protein
MGIEKIGSLDFMAQDAGKQDLLIFLRTFLLLATGDWHFPVIKSVLNTMTLKILLL